MSLYEKVWVVQHKIDNRIHRLPDKIGLLMGGFLAAILILLFCGYNSSLDFALIFISAFSFFGVPLAVFIAKGQTRKEVKKWHQSEQSGFLK